MLPPELEDGASRPSDCLTGRVLFFEGETIYELRTVEKDEVYSEKIGHPIFVVMYTFGKGEGTRERTIFATDNRRYMYLHGIGAMPGTLDNVEAVYQDILVGLYLLSGATSSGDDPDEEEGYNICTGF